MTVQNFSSAVDALNVALPKLQAQLRTQRDNDASIEAPALIGGLGSGKLFFSKKLASENFDNLLVLNCDLLTALDMFCTNLSLLNHFEAAADKRGLMIVDGFAAQAVAEQTGIRRLIADTIRDKNVALLFVETDRRLAQNEFQLSTQQFQPNSGATTPRNLQAAIDAALAAGSGGNSKKTLHR